MPKTYETEILAAAAGQVVRNKAVIEYHETPGPEWWVMLPDGSIEVLSTPGAALKAIRRQVAKVLNMTRTSQAIVTVIEWRDTPAGFVPPKG